MINFDPLLEIIEDYFPEIDPRGLNAEIGTALNILRNSNLPGWYQIIEKLPKIDTGVVKYDNPVITIGDPGECSDELRISLEKKLKKLHPWRKGPYSLFGILIDTEWRSDLKWARFSKHIKPLEDRIILDVGSGNGYYCWRMLGKGARLVIGIEPYILSVIQFNAFKKNVGNIPIHTLPFSLENIPEGLSGFDTVFSMGVLYHQRSPFDHLYRLKKLMRPGGELILESLIINGNKNEVLVPEDRYAKMRNVWFIPTPLTLESWLKRAGFKNIRLIDVTRTTSEEQRSTEWMTYESLKDYLDPDNPDRTVEGYPAPERAIFIAEHPV